MVKEACCFRSRSSGLWRSCSISPKWLLLKSASTGPASSPLDLLYSINFCLVMRIPNWCYSTCGRTRTLYAATLVSLGAKVKFRRRRSSVLVALLVTCILQKKCSLKPDYAGSISFTGLVYWYSAISPTYYGASEDCYRHVYTSDKQDII